MIKTTRSRLEIRQEPDRASSVVGALLVAVGATESLLAIALLAAELFEPTRLGMLIPAIRLTLSAAFALSGWFFLSGRSRVVLDLDHRMVARYMGVGSRAAGGNQSWDLLDFVAVVLVRRERRRALAGSISRTEAVCLRRPDGSDLELHWSPDGGAEIAARVADFTGLPFLGRGRP
ncbi:MAG: hypothetical protein KGJ84_10365 [Elusimicrobia bacterium]|nr:hypothetical protein [Elusimicrobiota bacterium]